MYASMASSPVASGPKRSLSSSTASQKGVGLPLGVLLRFGGVEESVLGPVVRRERRYGVAEVAHDTELVAQRRNRIAGGVVDPRAAQIDRHAREVDGVQPAADTVARLEHHTRNARPAQPRCGGQSRDACADNNHPVDGTDDFAHRAILRHSVVARQGRSCRDLCRWRRYPVAMEPGGHPVRHLDAGDVLQRLRIEDRQLASIGGVVIDVAHEHSLVLRRIR